MKQQLIDRLHAEGCSCVIHNDDNTLLFHKRGVQDLHQLLRTSPEVLCGAMIADKVVGKATAFLYCLLRRRVRILLQPILPELIKLLHHL